MKLSRGSIIFNGGVTVRAGVDKVNWHGVAWKVNP